MGFTPAMRIVALILVGLAMTGLVWKGYGIYQADQRSEQAAALSKHPAPEATPAVPKPVPPPVKKQVQVHVEGAVHSPGVYTFEEGARVHEAVAAAGGALPDGVPGALNLAAPLTDGSKVYVYTRAELQPAALPPPVARAATYAPVAATEPARPAPSAAKTPVAVNINTATATDLEAVPGIGPSTARAIVEHRSKHGPFKRMEDLTSISGIGPKTLERLRPYLKV